MGEVTMIDDGYAEVPAHICPVCGSSHTLVKESRDVPFEYRGHTKIIKAVYAIHCNHCGDSMCDFDRPEDWDRMDREMEDHKAEIDAKLGPRYKEGDKSRGLCDKCGVNDTTFVRVDLPFSDGVGVAKNILAGKCDGCGQVIFVPAQSTPEIAAARKEAMAALSAPKVVDPLDQTHFEVTDAQMERMMEVANAPLPQQAASLLNKETPWEGQDVVIIGAAPAVVNVASEPASGESGVVVLDADLNPHMGGNFDDFLKEQGIFEEVTEMAKSRLGETGDTEGSNGEQT